MIELLWWWMLLLLPFPLVVRWLSKPASVASQAALYVPFFTAVTGSHHDNNILRLPSLVIGGWSIVWILLILSTSRPIWLGDAVPLSMAGRDLLLAVDISGSMEEEDFPYKGKRLTRLQAVKAVAGEFIERRQGDHVGLLLFGTRAYMQTPLTFDVKTVRHFLDEAVIGLAGKKTAVGDAIGLAVKHLREKPAASRVLILLTDGASTAGVISPDEAARLARQADVRVHTIGVGGTAQAMGLFRFMTHRLNDLDEASLKEIAKTTGGKYFRAHDINELEQIYRLIDELEPTDAESELYRPVTELYPWPLTVMLCIASVLCWRRWMA